MKIRIKTSEVARKYPFLMGHWEFQDENPNYDEKFIPNRRIPEELILEGEPLE